MSKFINIIIHPVGTQCNIACDYCYIPLHNEIEVPENILFNNITKLIDCICRDKDLINVNFTWHGGEPLLMRKNFFKKVLLYQNTHIKK